MTTAGTRAPEVSLVIANWQGAPMLGRCLSSLQLAARHAGRPWEMIVVDDASTDDGPAMIREQFPTARLLVNRENIGFARTVNRGAAAARGRILVLANNDIVARQDFVERLIRWFDTPAEQLPANDRRARLFGVSARTQSWYDGRANQLCMAAVWRGGRLTPAWDDPRSVSRCLFVQAGAAAYDLALFRKLGGMSTLYEPGYWEDYDLSWRAARRGWINLYDPEAFALHVGGGSMTRRYGSEGVMTLRARNHLLFEAARLRDAGLLAEWLLRIPLTLGREVSASTQRRLFTRAAIEAARRLPRALAERLRDPSGISDRRLLAPFRHFTPS